MSIKRTDGTKSVERTRVGSHSYEFYAFSRLLSSVENERRYGRRTEEEMRSEQKDRKYRVDKTDSPHECALRFVRVINLQSLPNVGAVFRQNLSEPIKDAELLVESSFFPVFSANK